MIKRIRRAPSAAQRLLLPVPATSAAPEAGIRGHAEFLRLDRSQLFVGEDRLDRYLGHVGLAWVVELAKLVANIDVEPFRAKYEGTGRRPHHPHVIIGLFVYGALQAKTSLRELEQLSLVDVGAWWICARHQPDHSAIGRFLKRHREHLSDAFFVEITRKLLDVGGVKRGTVAMDGTVVEAATSRLKMMRTEALKAAFDEEKSAVAISTADERPDRLEKLKAAVAIAVERQERREAHGKEGSIKVSVDEPEAVNQPLKNGLDRPSYKPVLSTHESGFIVGQTVEPSSENAALPTLMKQHQQLFSAAPKRLLLDSGFFATATLTMMIEADVDVLCPPPGMLKDHDKRKHFGKHRFAYDTDTDVYRCPAKQELVAIERSEVARAGSYTKYGGAQCTSCPLRAQCTDAKRGRTIKRFTHDDEKEAMRAVLGDRRAQREYRKRQHIAETPNATIKNIQGLTRFRRRGLQGAKLEIALHCVALNLGRASALVLVIMLNRRPVAVVVTVAG